MNPTPSQFLTSMGIYLTSIQQDAVNSTFEFKRGLGGTVSEPAPPRPVTPIEKIAASARLPVGQVRTIQILHGEGKTVITICQRTKLGTEKVRKVLRASGLKAVDDPVKLTDIIIGQIMDDRKTGTLTLDEIARKHGVSIDSVRAVVKGKTRAARRVADNTTDNRPLANLAEREIA